MPQTEPRKNDDTVGRAEAHWLRAQFIGPAVGVDRVANVLRGYVMAQEGPFRDPRGEFDLESLRSLVRLGGAHSKGLKSRFAHPSLSDDGVGKFLGRARDLRLDKAVDARTGKTVHAVRGDLHFDKTALEEPVGGGKPMGQYIMDLAESDADALSSSFVLEADEEFRLEPDGTRKLDNNGDPLPPLWRPTRLHASDIVDSGAACDGLLSAPELAQALSVGLTPELQKLLRFDRVARLAGQLLDGLFPGKDKATVDERCRAWLARYLDARYRDATPRPKLQERRDRLARMAEVAGGV